MSIIKLNFVIFSPISDHFLTPFREDAVPDGEERGAAAVRAAGDGGEGEVRHVRRRGEDLVGVKHQHGEPGGQL